MVGCMHGFGGLGLPRSRRHALKWTAEAAERGHADAMFNLGVMYCRGLGTGSDLARAAKW